MDWCSEGVLVGHWRSVRCARFSPCGNWLLSGSTDRTIRVWDVKSFQEIARYHAVYTVGTVWWSPDGRIIRAVDFGGSTTRPRVYELELMSRPSDTQSGQERTRPGFA